MIFERREYELRPGRLPEFWDAQRKWNVGETAAALIRNNLCYFSVAGTDRVVHLYRFDSLQDWQGSYEEYYRTQVGEYFRTARPWVLQQQNCLLASPPVAELSSWWAGDVPQVPSAVLGQESEAVVLERRLDFLPGGLPAYWDAQAGLLKEPPRYWEASHMATLSTLTGRHHRVFTYHCFKDLGEADLFARQAQVDERWAATVDAYRDQVVASEVTILRPSPVPQQRSIFTAGR